MTNSNTDQEVAQYFDRFAEIYADSYTNGSFISYPLNQRLKIVCDFLKDYGAQAIVLDVGCGPGIMVDYCTSKGFNFFGIDISEKMIDVCIKKFGHINSNHFSVGKLQSLEFPDSFFDVVLCMGALEYLDEAEIDSAVSEMARVLKPNGLIVMSLLNKRSFYSWSKDVWNSLLKKFSRHESEDELSRLFNENSFRTLLASHQLTNVDAVYFGLNLFPSCSEKMFPTKLRILTNLALKSVFGERLSWLCTAFILKIRKST